MPAADTYFEFRVGGTLQDFKVVAVGFEFGGHNCQRCAFVATGGRYKLDLSRPYHRAMLRMLCKTAERYKARDLGQVFWFRLLVKAVSWPRNPTNRMNAKPKLNRLRAGNWKLAAVIDIMQ